MAPLADVRKSILLVLLSSHVAHSSDSSHNNYCSHSSHQQMILIEKISLGGWAQDPRSRIWPKDQSFKKDFN